MAETQHIKQGVIIMGWNDVFNMLWEYMRKLRAHDKSKDVEIGVRMTYVSGALVCRVFGSVNHGPEYTVRIMYYPPQEVGAQPGDELVKRLLEEVGK